MGMMKDQYHAAICQSSRMTKSERTGLEYAQEEYYDEMKRRQYDKQRRLERETRREYRQGIPIAAPVEPRYEGRRIYMADPATDTERFEQVCREADAEATKTGMNIVVFKNSENNYLTWEEKYISSANPIEALYTAQAPEGK